MIKVQYVYYISWFSRDVTHLVASFDLQVALIQVAQEDYTNTVSAVQKLYVRNYYFVSGCIAFYCRLLLFIVGCGSIMSFISRLPGVLLALMFAVSFVSACHNDQTEHYFKDGTVKCLQAVLCNKGRWCSNFLSCNPVHKCSICLGAVAGCLSVHPSHSFIVWKGNSKTYPQTFYTFS